MATTNMSVRFTPNDKGNPPGKLADAELHFTDGPLEGLKLIGLAIWETQSGDRRNVTFPARQYSVNGERRSFALLRPISDSTAQERIRGLVLDAYASYEEELGLYGVTAYSVSRRRSEIGIRIALGASPTKVVRLVVSRVALLVGIGAVAGTAASLWLSRFVAFLLYELEPRDPATLLGAVVVLVAVGLAAGALPATRAARIDPAAVLRES